MSNSTPSQVADAVLDVLAKSVYSAVYDAILTIMSATGGYPLTREDVLDAITKGVASLDADDFLRLLK